MARLGAMSKTLFDIGLAIALAAALLVTTVRSADAAGGVIGNLRGSVVDGQTGAPISGASITAILTGESSGCSTSVAMAAGAVETIPTGVRACAGSAGVAGT